MISHFEKMLAAAIFLSLVGCKTPRPAVPGHTPYVVADVRFEGATIGLGELPKKLALRAGNLLIVSQNYNAYRAEEDRRRVRAYWMTRGFLEAKVEGPAVKRLDPEKEAVITWKITEGARYRIGSVQVKGAPHSLHRDVEALVPFKTGAPVDDVQAWRLKRVEMSELMRSNGYAHAETFSRLFIHKATRKIHWIYYVDAGPKTRVGKVTIHGAKKIPEELIRRQLGLKTGDSYDHRIRRKAQMDLLDLGSFNVVRIKDNVDNEFLIGVLPPDKGGTFRADHVDEGGNPIARNLDAAVDLDVYVTEGPAHKGRVGVGVGADIERLDGHLSLRNEFRDLLGPAHHVLLDGRVAYGWLFRGQTGDPLGLHGDGVISYNHAGFLHPTLALRIYGKWAERLFDGYHSRGLRAGASLRSTLAPRTFLDLELAYRLEWPVGLPDFEAAAAEAIAFDDGELSTGVVKLSFLVDRRDNPVEALRGSLFGLHAAWAPVGSHATLSLGGNARVFLQVADAMALGLRLRGHWVFDIGGEGLPPAVRLYGGGAFGMRGFSHQDLTSHLEHCLDGVCRRWGVGALSLMEATLDFRWLPFRKQVGANVFVDLGGASSTANPFEDGVSVAVGAGARIRLWYIPLSLDLSYRVTDNPELSHLSPWLFFARIGESF